MSDTVQLVGLDLGTTTSSAIVAEARLCKNAVTGRSDLADVRTRFRSELAFTPLHEDDRIDESAAAKLVDGWLEAGGVRVGEIFGGGALLTGLTAQRDNAAALLRLIRARLGDALVAAADDPCLESWLAFMGSAADLSLAHPELRVLNLDIGGGTTNLALGQAGEVLRTGCLFVGARHVQVKPGTYRLERLSRCAAALFDQLGIRKTIDDELAENQVDAILSYYLDLLAAALAGRRERFEEATARLHEQVPFRPLAGEAAMAITISGGVGELVYAHFDGKPWPPTTAFGDLGIDLARRLVRSKWADDFRRHRPTSAGRATVHGLLRHGTEISGSTLFLPRPEMLPLADLPIIGSITLATAEDEMQTLMEVIVRNRGGCLRVEVGSHRAADVQAIGTRIGTAVRALLPGNVPLVLMVRENLGKVLGQIVTHWGTLSHQVMVIDEIPTRNARFARIGKPCQQVVPVSLYGLAGW